MINLDLERQINDQIQSVVNSYLNSDDLKNKIKEQVDTKVGQIIESVAGRVYSEVIQENNISEHVINIIKLESNQHIHNISLDIVRDHLSKIPVQDIVAAQVKREIDISFSRLEFPTASIPVPSIDWKDGLLSGSYIQGGIIRNFSSSGIDDKSNNIQLTILDDHVVVENNFTAAAINAAESISTKDLSLTGTLEIGTDIIDHGALASLIQTHFEIKIDEQLEPFKKMLVDGEPIVNQNSISPSVVSSNLRKLGNLTELNVMGDAKFSETLYVSSDGKIGINTEEPRGALTIRDEDAEFSVFRTSRRTMFIGSTRDANLEIGVNDQANIKIEPELITISNAIRIMGLKFSVLDKVPEYVGEPNEIVFVNTARDNQPFLYICRGSNKWAALAKI
jgi:hypothetical protein